MLHPNLVHIYLNLWIMYTFSSTLLIFFCYNLGLRVKTKCTCILNNIRELNKVSTVTNFIQLVSPQLVDQFSQTKLHWKAPNKNYLYICGIYKRNNKQPRYQVISSCKNLHLLISHKWLDGFAQLNLHWKVLIKPFLVIHGILYSDKYS